MRIASRWAKTGSLKVLGDTQHPWQHVLRLGHIQATRRCRGMRDRAVWQAVWNSAVFRCISLYDAPYMRLASSRLPPGAIQPYSAIQRHTALYEHTAIQHHTAYSPYNTPQAAPKPVVRIDVTLFNRTKGFENTAQFATSRPNPGPIKTVHRTACSTSAPARTKCTRSSSR